MNIVSYTGLTDNCLCFCLLMPLKWRWKLVFVNDCTFCTWKPQVHVYQVLSFTSSLLTFSHSHRLESEQYMIHNDWEMTCGHWWCNPCIVFTFKGVISTLHQVPFYCQQGEEFPLLKVLLSDCGHSNWTTVTKQSAQLSPLEQ